MQPEQTGRKVFETSDGRLAYSVNDFSKLVGVGRSTTFGEIKAGRLIALKVGKRTIITDENGRAWLAGLPTAREGV